MNRKEDISRRLAAEEGMAFARAWKLRPDRFDYDWGVPVVENEWQLPGLRQPRAAVGRFPYYRGEPSA